MTKVLICYHSSNYGGVEKHILDIIACLNGRFEIFIACPDGALRNEYIKNNATWKNISPKSDFDILYIFKIYKLCKTNGISVIHGHELKTGTLSLIAGYLANVKIRIYHVHTPISMWQYSIIKRLLGYSVNYIVNFIISNFIATKVVALTESIKNIKTHKEFTSTNKIVCIPNGIDLKEYRRSETARRITRKKNLINDRTLVLLNISRFTIEKGHRYLLYAYADFLKYSGINTVLVLGGKGVLLEEIKNLARSLNITDKIIFKTELTDKEKLALYNMSDIFVFPSIAEGFGIILIEAMAMQLPTIASDLDVLKDVAKDSVLYFKVKDYKDLANKIKALSENITLSNDLKKKAYERVKIYDMKNFCENYYKLYSGLI